MELLNVCSCAGKSPVPAGPLSPQFAGLDFTVSSPHWWGLDQKPSSRALTGHRGEIRVE